RRAGAWVLSALLTHRLSSGWAHVTTGLLTIDHALGCLLARLLGLAATTDLDDARVLSTLDDDETRTSWREVDATIREGLIDWARGAIGPVTPLALAAAARATRVSPVAVGLALDVLWPTGEQPL